MSTSSVPSHVSSSSERGTPIPVSASPVPGPFRVLSPGQSAVALSKYTDHDLRHKNSDELVGMIRQLESENRSIMAEHSSIIKDVNRRIQMYHLEIKGLKDINQKLQDDNQELRDLCCFLDDDRQRGRKLAREWQRFGRYTASVMRSEVSAYQEKLAALEKKQDDLINDNMELKELCLYLDQERIRFMQTRDEGDGSSNSTTAGNEEYSHLFTRLDVDGMSSNVSDRNVTDSAAYVPQGETSTSRHDQEKTQPTQNRSFELRGTPVGNNEEHNLNASSSSHNISTKLSPPAPSSLNLTNTSIDSPSKPEAVVHAMKVLEVHEQLEKAKVEHGGENLDDKEKAIVREMCNVVWRKLGDVGSERSTPQVTPHPTYENITYRGSTLPPQSLTFSPPIQRHSSRSSPMHQQQQPPQQQNLNRRHNPPQHKGQPQPPYHQNPASTKYSPTDSSHGQQNKPPPHPGVSQTVHSNAVPNYQHYRSPPPSQPMESISASTTTTYINDPLLSPPNQPDTTKECNDPPHRPPPRTKTHSKSPTSYSYPSHPHQHQIYLQTRSVSQSPLPRPQSVRVTPTQSKHFSESDLQNAGSLHHYACSVGDLRSYNQDPRDLRRRHEDSPLHNNQQNSSEDNIVRNSSQQFARGVYRTPPDPRNGTDVMADRSGNTRNMSYH